MASTIGTTTLNFRVRNENGCVRRVESPEQETRFFTIFSTGHASGRNDNGLKKRGALFQSRSPTGRGGLAQICTSKLCVSDPAVKPPEQNAQNQVQVIPTYKSGPRLERRGKCKTLSIRRPCGLLRISRLHDAQQQIIAALKRTFSPEEEFRCISTSRLSTLLCVHLKPINVIISYGS